MSRNKNKNNEAETPSTPQDITSTLQARWEDGILGAMLTRFKALRTKDGQETPVAAAANKVENIMLRVGALTSKTKSGAAAVDGKDRIVERFEILPIKLHDAESGSNDTTYITLNWRVGAVDLPFAALQALITSLAYGIVRAACNTPEELKKAKRFGTVEFKSMLESIGLTRNADKVDGKTTGYTWSLLPGGPADVLLAESIAEVGEFPAEALAFFTDKETINRSASIFVDFDGVVSKLQYNGKVEAAVALVNAFLNAGVKIARVQYEHAKLADEASVMLPGLVYLGKGTTEPHAKSPAEGDATQADIAQAEAVNE